MLSNSTTVNRTWWLLFVCLFQFSLKVLSSHFRRTIRPVVTRWNKFLIVCLVLVFLNELRLVLGFGASVGQAFLVRELCNADRYGGGDGSDAAEGRVHAAFCQVFRRHHARQYLSDSQNMLY